MTHDELRAEAWRSLNEELTAIIEQRNQLREALCRIAAHTTDGVKAKEMARAALKQTEKTNGRN